MARRATPRARQIAGLTLGFGALLLGCQAEEARLVAGDANAGGIAAAAISTAAPSPAPAASPELVATCVEYVGTKAMLGDGFAIAVVDQTGGAPDGVQHWCEGAATTDPASLRRMGKELAVIRALTGPAPTTTTSTLAPATTGVSVPALPAPTVPVAPRTTAPAPAAAVIVGQGCDPNYTGACVPIAVDVDCAGRGGNGPVYVVGPVRVVGEDIYGLDGNRDRIGCD